MVDNIAQSVLCLGADRCVATGPRAGGMGGWVRKILTRSLRRIVREQSAHVRQCRRKFCCGRRNLKQRMPLLSCGVKAPLGRLTGCFWLENPSIVSRLQKARSQSNNIPRAGVPGARRRRQSGAYSNAQRKNAAAGDRVGLQVVWAFAPARSQRKHTHKEYTFVR